MTGTRWVALLACGIAAVACSRSPEPAAGPSQEGRYSSLPDTLICVVDRTTTRGLRNLAAKKDEGGGVVLLVSGEIRPVEALHPVRLVAGYAGQEPWFTDGGPITVEGRKYVRVEGERRIPLESLQQGGEYRAIPLFVDPQDQSPPQAVYVPVRPGCVFQAYVREELLGSRPPAPPFPAAPGPGPRSAVD